jgi:hypothetical protein
VCGVSASNHSAALRYHLGTFCSPHWSTVTNEEATFDRESELMLCVDGTYHST